MLNLAAVATQNAGDPEYDDSPFFKAADAERRGDHQAPPAGRRAVHVRQPRRIATKVIIPFERTDLGLGGRSLFVGQRGWQELLLELRGGSRRGARHRACWRRWTSCPRSIRSCCAST